MRDVEDVIRRMAFNILHPERLFSHYNSRAFTSAGQGDFEIDEEIEMEHLDQAGYIFGCNYHGDLIVKDANVNAPWNVIVDLKWL